jgi:hypothetical protein
MIAIMCTCLSSLPRIGPRRHWPLALSAALFFAGPALALTPREEVLRLVPEDAGFCLLVQGLRHQAQAFHESPFYEQFRTSTFGSDLLQSPGAVKLSQLEQHLQKHLGLTWPRIRDELIGDAVALAYRATSSGGKDGDQGLILVRARDARLLADVVTRLNELQLGSGEVKAVEARKHHDAEYFCRVEAKRNLFYYLRGPLLAFTSQEDLLRDVIDRDRQSEGKEIVLVRQLQRLGADAALATLWVNPRAFDRELERKAATAKGAEVLVLRRIEEYWKAIDGLALSATVNPGGPEIALTFLAREGAMPAAVRRFFDADAKPSDLWERFPDRALVAVAGRLDALELTGFLGDFLPAEARRAARDTVNREFGAALGLDIVQDVLPNLGPDWGVCITAPAASDRSPLPALVAAIRVRPGSTVRPVDRALLDGLHSLAVLVVLGYNNSHTDAIRLETVRQDQVEVQFLKNGKGFPPGWQPAFALKAGYLLLATSPEAIRAFRATPNPSAAAGPDLPLLRVSIREFRAYLNSHLDFLAARVAEDHGISPDAAAKKLRGLLSLCECFERVELARRAGPGKVALVLRARTEKPMSR